MNFVLLNENYKKIYFKNLPDSGSSVVNSVLSTSSCITRVSTNEAQIPLTVITFHLTKATCIIISDFDITTKLESTFVLKTK